MLRMLSIIVLSISIVGLSQADSITRLNFLRVEPVSLAFLFVYAPVALPATIFKIT